MNVTLGFLIKAFREEKNISRDLLARRLGISKGYLGHLENDRPLTLSNRIADRLFTSVGFFVPKRLQEYHNAKAKRYYKQYHRSKNSK